MTALAAAADILNPPLLQDERAQIAKPAALAEERQESLLPGSDADMAMSKNLILARWAALSGLEKLANLKAAGTLEHQFMVQPA